MLKLVPDPRARRGIRHGLPGIVAVALAAVAAGARSFAAIGQWAGELTGAQLAELGLSRPSAPDGRHRCCPADRLQGLRSADARTAAKRLLAQFHLEEAADKPIAQFSGGMRRRLDLAASLITRPPLIFLDEPTTGLDRAPASRCGLQHGDRFHVSQLSPTSRRPSKVARTSISLGAGIPRNWLADALAGAATCS
jgi:hypothetical protein